MIFIGLDDTDNPDSRGTGHLARLIAAHLAATYPTAGVTRHQLLFDPRVPYTAKNSCAAILLDTTEADLPALFATVKALMLDHFEQGSDPGLAVAQSVPDTVTAFGQRAKRDLVRQDEALALAEAESLLLAGLGGTNDGVIGALAAIGLAAGGEDGRYVQVGASRDLAGLVPAADVLAAGIGAIRTLAEEPVREGLVLADKVRPARRSGQPVLYVETAPEGHWQPLKLD